MCIRIFPLNGFRLCIPVSSALCFIENIVVVCLWWLHFRGANTLACHFFRLQLDTMLVRLLLTCTVKQLLILATDVIHNPTVKTTIQQSKQKIIEVFYRRKTRRRKTDRKLAQHKKSVDFSRVTKTHRVRTRHLKSKFRPTSPMGWAWSNLWSKSNWYMLSFRFSRLSFVFSYSN